MGDSHLHRYLPRDRLYVLEVFGLLRCTPCIHNYFGYLGCAHPDGLLLLCLQQISKRKFKLKFRVVNVDCSNIVDLCWAFLFAHRLQLEIPKNFNCCRRNGGWIFFGHEKNCHNSFNLLRHLGWSVHCLDLWSGRCCFNLINWSRLYSNSANFLT